MWAQCTVCRKWYQDTEYLSCRDHRCANFTGTQLHPLASRQVPVQYGFVQAQPQVGRVVPGPTAHAITVVDLPRPQVATITKPTVPLLTVPEPSQPSVHPPCVACKEAEPGITTHCGLPICHGCIEGGKQHALFQVVGNEVRCYYCHKPIDPSVYVGKVETAILEPVMKTVGFLKEKQSSSAMSEEASAWNLSVLCPNADCRQPLPGLEGGCDIIQCTKCGVQLNLATGEMKKSGLAHTFTVGKFLQFISGFDARQGNYVIKRCQTEFAGLWKRFKFDVLLHRLEGASTRQEREALIATLVAPEVQSLKAFFAIQYLR